MDSTLIIPTTAIEVLETGDFPDITDLFTDLPMIMNPVIDRAHSAVRRIERILYTMPAFIRAVKALVPEETLRAVLTDEQKQQIAKGALRIMVRKDGSLLPSIVDTQTGRIVKGIPLEKVKATPSLSTALADYSSQMQMAQLAEQIQEIQVAVEEIHAGQEHDRLGEAMGIEQRLLCALEMKTPHLREAALLAIAGDAEGIRNRLMRTQADSVEKIKAEPEDYWGKLLRGESSKKIDMRMSEIRMSLCALNMVSLAESLAYIELGEPDAAKKSLQYYGKYLQRTYLSTPNFLERLNMLEPSRTKYWTVAIPAINNNVCFLESTESHALIGGDKK